MKDSSIANRATFRSARRPVGRRRLRSTQLAIRQACVEALEARRLMSFSPAVSYAVGTAPAAVITADFDGNGRLDIATANNGSASVSALLDNAGGTFGAAASSATGGAPLSLASGDFNGDGKTDLATANAGNVSVLLGNGNGTFQAPTNIDIGSTPASVAVGDFNGDGKLDLAVTSNVYYPGYSGWYGWYPGSYAGRVNVLMGNGGGAFAAPTVVPLGYGQHASGAAADFNHDGKLDFVAVNVDYGTATVLLGTVTGGLGNGTSFNTGWYPRAVTVGDFTGDGILDLAAGGQSVDVLPGIGDGTFRQVVRQYVDPVALAATDFDGDGRLDLMTADNGSNVAVLLNTGVGGTFRPSIDTPVGTGAASVAVGDFNADGRPDAVSANSGSNNVSVLLNAGNWPAPNAPTISVGDISVTEGNTGTVNASFVVSLSNVFTQTVTVNYVTADGSAMAASDYQSNSGTVTFAAGETSKTVNVLVNGDGIGEPSETFALTLSQPTNSFLGDATGWATIVDNEPTISIDDYSAAEGQTGMKAFNVTVRLSNACDAPVSVNYSTAEGDTEWWGGGYYYYYYAPPSAATAGVDFQSATGSVTFAAGETIKTIVVMVNGDREGEPGEVFSVDLSNPTGATFADNHAVATIVDDEPFVSVSGGGNVPEGNTGTKLLPFTITLSNPSDVAVTVNYATADGSATAGGGDYVTKSGSVTFEARETTKTVNVTVNGDRLAEGDEYVYLILTGATNAGIGTSQSYSYIVDDEPRISINSVSMTEGDRGTKLMTFTVTLSSAYDQAVTVNYATYDSSARAGGSDYTAKSGTLTFAAGQTTKTVTVTIRGDKKREYDESFYVLLRNPSTNALIENAYGWGTILDDDRS